MNLNDVLAKLEPLIPEKVTHWRRSLEVADQKLQQLLEQHIRWTARTVLGNEYDRKMLLSLPPERLAAGRIQLGTVLYDKPRWPFGLSEGELLQHLAILGRSGAGKSNVSYLLLQQLSNQGIPWLFLDWKRAARDLVTVLPHQVRVVTAGRNLAPFPFNPFLVPPGVEQTPYVNLVVDQFADAYTLGEGAKSVLQKALVACYAANPAPKVRDVIAHIESLQTKERSTGWKTTTLRALQSYDLAVPDVTTSEEQAAFARGLLRGRTILELDSLSHSTKKLLIPLLCQWLYSVQLGHGKRERLQFVIFLEEAHHTLYRNDQRTKETALAQVLRQAREIGLAFCLIDQQPHTLSTAALGNCFATICLNQKHPSDINTARELSAVGPSEKHLFSSLPVGQGVVKLQGRWTRPLLVQFPLMPIKKGLVTDALLAEYLRGISGGTTWNTLARPTRGLSGTRPAESTETGTPQSADSLVNPRVPVLDTTSLAFLRDCALNPDDAVRTRYRRLGIGASTGTKLKNRLVAAGLLETQSVKVERSTRTDLRVTETARKLLTPDGDGRDGRASLTHEVIKAEMVDHLAAAGVKADFEVARKTAGGRADIVARTTDKDGPASSVVIEIETGASDVVGNVLKNLKEGYGQIVVIATDAVAQQKIERQLDRAGLLIPPRVRVMLRADTTQ